MSGGSRNYLCLVDAEDIVCRIEDVEEIACDLEKLGAPEVAEASRALADEVREYARHAEKLEKSIARVSAVWKALEWWESGDTSREDFEDAVKAWKQGGKA